MLPARSLGDLVDCLQAWGITDGTNPLDPAPRQPTADSASSTSTPAATAATTAATAATAAIAARKVLISLIRGIERELPRLADQDPQVAVSALALLVSSYVPPVRASTSPAAAAAAASPAMEWVPDAAVLSAAEVALVAALAPSSTTTTAASTARMADSGVRSVGYGGASAEAASSSAGLPLELHATLLYSLARATKLSATAAARQQQMQQMQQQGQQGGGGTREMNPKPLPIPDPYVPSPQTLAAAADACGAPAVMAAYSPSQLATVFTSLASLGARLGVGWLGRFYDYMIPSRVSSDMIPALALASASIAELASTWMPRESPFAVPIGKGLQGVAVGPDASGGTTPGGGGGNAAEGEGGVPAASEDLRAISPSSPLLAPLAWLRRLEQAAVASSSSAFAVESEALIRLEERVASAKQGGQAVWEEEGGEEEGLASTPLAEAGGIVETPQGRALSTRELSTLLGALRRQGLKPAPSAVALFLDLGLVRVKREAASIARQRLARELARLRQQQMQMEGGSARGGDATSGGSGEMAVVAGPEAAGLIGLLIFCLEAECLPIGRGSPVLAMAGVAAGGGPGVEGGRASSLPGRRGLEEVESGWAGTGSPYSSFAGWRAEAGPLLMPVVGRLKDGTMRRALLDLLQG